MITVLSITSVTAFMSLVLVADVITAESEIPFLSVNICLFVPSLHLSKDYFQSSPP